jgi:hypothetical protein
MLGVLFYAFIAASAGVRAGEIDLEIQLRPKELAADYLDAQGVRHPLDEVWGARAGRAPGGPGCVGPARDLPSGRRTTVPLGQGGVLVVKGRGASEGWLTVGFVDHSNGNSRWWNLAVPAYGARECRFRIAAQEVRLEMDAADWEADTRWFCGHKALGPASVRETLLKLSQNTPNGQSDLLKRLTAARDLLARLNTFNGKWMHENWRISPYANAVLKQDIETLRADAEPESAGTVPHQAAPFHLPSSNP